MLPQRRAPLSTEEPMAELNISPLIDMVFILLIFFIVTTVFVETPGVEVSKPRAATAVTLEKSSILFAITEGGQVIYGGRDVGLGGVRPIVRRLLAKEKRPVVVEVDGHAQGAMLVRVIEEAVLGGAERASIATERL